MLEQLGSITINIVGLTFLLGFGLFGLVSIWEGEARAVKAAFSAALISSIPFFLLANIPKHLGSTALIVLGVLVIGLVVLFFLPIGRIKAGNDTPQTRFDERDVVFSRYYLVPGTPEYSSYYAMRPENESGDERMRNRPGLYSTDALIVNPSLLASPKASFFLTDALYAVVDGPVSNAPVELPPKEATEYIKSLAKYYGALDVGITKLKPYHVYSHNGRGSGIYGAPIPVNHGYAIAFTVEMDHKMMGSVFASSLETAKQYVEMTRVAVQLAAAIRFLGYSARANFEGDYQVIVPLVARDAGLGEFGRLSVVVTPHNGPRVRIAVVTTDLELIPDPRIDGAAVIDFCTLCKKCAQNCPSKAIPFGDRLQIEGALRWKIDSEACYSYWNTSGVDCVVCVAVCPYSHPNHLIHNIIRWAISKSGFARRVALTMDDLFYGRKPSKRVSAKWIRARETDTLSSKDPNRQKG